MPTDMSSVRKWKFDNLKHLQGATFRLVQYKALSEEWYHDHCNGCWAKFAEYDAPEIQHQGYVTSIPDHHSPETDFIKRCKEQGMRVVPQPAIDGQLLQWVCQKCFNDFREALQFKVEEEISEQGK